MSASLTIHRLLDEAFVGIPVTPEVQDLKEEIRTNLVARVAELTSAGADPVEAAHQAVAELGDIREVVDETSAVSAGTPPWARHRVRPAPTYVVRTVVLSLVGAAAVALVALPFFGVSVSLALPVAAVFLAAVAGGVIVADALRQETTLHYPIPAGRARGFGAATALVLAGVGTGALYWQDLPLPWLVGGAVAVVAGVALFAYLGASQTNRSKPWVVRMQAEQAELGDNFSKDPAAAARFGIYTVVIWVLAFAAFAVLGVTVGWAWSWLALLGGLALMMLILARMLFGAHPAA
jgi:hypothetical protein